MKSKDNEQDASWLKRFRAAVRKWFAAHPRELSWRGTRDPYEIWISEIMLQQTTTAAVEGYYTRFLQRFPNVKQLALAEVSEVYRLWEGLGYYRRAAMLHKAAGEICSRFQSVFPERFEEVLSLPGIGRYTAGAILSIAYDRRLPILEANTIRLHSRLLALETEPTSKEGNAILWDFAERVLPQKEIGHFNQALMDIGSRVCLVKNPLCYDKCPLFPFCKATQNNRQNDIPILKKKPEFTGRTEIAILLKNKGKILLVQSPESRRWAGLWDFPRVTLEKDEEIYSDEFAEKFSQVLGRKVELKSEILHRKHVVTRYKITLRLHEALDHGVVKIATAEKPLHSKWVPVKDLHEIPLNSTVRKLVDELFS